MPTHLRLHATYRYPRVTHQIAEWESDYEDFFEATRWPDWPGLAGAGRAQLEQGINGIRPISAVDGPRRAAILILINPLKAGSEWTPWHDEIDPRNGFVRYYGDNKPTLRSSPDHTTGNQAVLAEFEHFGSNRVSDRGRAAPLLFFENVAREGRSKGFRRFRGVGIVDRVERVIQVDPKNEPFVNYRFDCTLLTMKHEDNQLNWDWISARRDPRKSVEESLRHAPVSWRTWVQRGAESRESVRQQLLTYRVVPDSEQRPVPGSREEATLREVMDFYAGSRKARFEALAERVAQLALGGNGLYRLGWVTKPSADQGIDFIGRMDLATDVGPLRVVVAGQAKCQISAITPADISRLAAKLGRGWVGVFV